MEHSFISEKIYLRENNENVFLDVYAVHDEDNKRKDAVLIIPGGAYGGVSWREGVYTGLAFAGRGINAFVLTYSVGAEAKYPRQLTDAALAMKHIKENAEKYHIDPNRIFALGYSAGGHLLGTLTTQYNYAETLLGLPKDYLKIRGAIFCYPVITALDNTHAHSFENLLKKPYEEMTDEERVSLSIEKCITPETPPAFIWHTSGDRGVPINGSLSLARAYYDAGTPVELHIYPYGPHGIALATDYTSNQSEAYVQPRAEVWLYEALKWMKGLDN
jgi:acetyl esterase/lipase